MVPTNPPPNFVTISHSADDLQSCLISDFSTRRFDQKFDIFSRMGRARDFSEHEKIRIQCWLQENVPTKEIAKRLNRHPGAVRKQVAFIKQRKPNASHSKMLKKGT